jgi:serine/threonine protein kinase
LKPENLLLTNKKRIKISDFGLSTKTNNYYDFLTTPCGTPSYAPPEMLRGDEYSGIYSDIWSCGIILYTMLVGNLPCAESKEYLIYECIIKHNYEYPSYLSDAVKDLLEKILKVNPQERIGFEQIKKHPWFNIINPRLRPGIILDVHKIPIDDNILNVVKNYDYKIEDVKYSVENSLYDDKTTIYYLILKQFIKEGKNSNSDLFSSDYLNFIKNLDNWIKPEKVNDDKFKEYRKWVDLKQTNKLFKPKKIDNNSVNLSTNNNKNNSINNIKSSNVRRTLNSMSFSNNNNNIKLDRKNRMENYSQRTRMLNDQHRRLFKSEGVIHKPNTARNSISNNNKINTNLLKSRNNIMKLNKEINKEHNRTFVLSSKPDRQSLNNNMNKTFYSFKKPFYNKLKKTKQKSLFVSFNEPIDSKTKETLLEDIEKNEKNFNDFYKKIVNTTSNPNQNIVRLLADKLISSTIFSKYLLNQKTIISSPKKTIINHDIEKNIFSIQKYKDLIENVKIKHIGLFRKKLYTFNSYTFSQYLNEEDDLILNENYIKQYHLSDFVNNLKFSIKNDEKQNLHQRLFSPSSNLNQSLNLNNSLLSSSRNSLFSSRRILSPNSSMLSNTTFNRKNYSKLNSLKSNISKMEGISEDEDSFEEEKNNNEKTTLRKNTTGSGSLKNKGKVGFNNNIRTINKISAFTPDDNNSKNQKKTSKSMKKNSRNDKNLMLNDSSIQNLNKTSGSTSLFSLSSKDKFSIKDEIERNEPINLSCIFDLQIIDIINKIKEYSKNNSAYCNVKGNQLRLNKANISIIIIIDKVHINDGFFLYLKIRSKSKNNEKQSLKLINDLLIYLQ